MALTAAAPGFSFGDPYALGALFVGFAVFVAVGALSHQGERAFSASMIYLAAGTGAAVLIHVFDLAWIDPVDDHAVLEHATEAAVVVALFGTGMSLDRPLRAREWSSTARLLVIAMPLTIAGVAALGSGLLGLSLGAAVVLGAVLAPTDPVLAGDVGVGPPGEEDEHEPNFGLTSEAGLNDGLAFPFLFAGLLVAEGAPSGDWLSWALGDVLYGIAGGVAAGAAVGFAAAWSVKRLRSADLLLKRFDGYHAVATALVVYGAAEALGVLGFVSAFAAGLAFRRYEHDHEVNHGVHEGAEQVEKLLELAVILLLGSLLTTEGLALAGWEGLLLVVTLVGAVRPAACLIALVGSRVARRDERAFVAWFGVRGVGSLYYAAFVAGGDVLPPGETRLIVWTAILAVLVSIPVHGATAGPALRRLIARRELRRRAPAPAATR
jgi:NhaP-type Na+/H+ or K+/H+ antiporter